MVQIVYLDSFHMYNDYAFILLGFPFECTCHGFSNFCKRYALHMEAAFLCFVNEGVVMRVITVFIGYVDVRTVPGWR